MFLDYTAYSYPIESLVRTKLVVNNNSSQGVFQARNPNVNNEYLNTPSKHFVGSRNPFLFIFVWHLLALAHILIALAHLNSTEKVHRL